MGKMENLTREQLERMVDVLSDLCFEFIDVQTMECFLISCGIEKEEMEAIGFDMVEEQVW